MWETSLVLISFGFFTLYFFLQPQILSWSRKFSFRWKDILELAELRKMLLSSFLRTTWELQMSVVLQRCQNSLLCVLLPMIQMVNMVAEWLILTNVPIATVQDVVESHLIELVRNHLLTCFNHMQISIFASRLALILIRKKQIWYFINKLKARLIGSPLSSPIHLGGLSFISCQKDFRSASCWTLL